MKNSFARNKKTYHNYTVIEDLEAGIVLSGEEVKSIKNFQANLKGAYIKILNNEAFIEDLSVSKYKHSSNKSFDTKRRKKLLLNKKEIEKLELEAQKSGLTILPLELYSKNGIIKLKIGLCKGKKLHDKRKDLKEKSQKLEIKRSLKNFK